ncbi:MAG: hypothetical protein C4523_16260 [Myxococcales bacterium]|nr:MAG: hypothetical protein C4523_16260 [Myxococcales bacterium]
MVFFLALGGLSNLYAETEARDPSSPLVEAVPDPLESPNSEYTPESTPTRIHWAGLRLGGLAGTANGGGGELSVVTLYWGNLFYTIVQGGAWFGEGVAKRVALRGTWGTVFDLDATGKFQLEYGGSVGGSIVEKADGQGFTLRWLFLVPELAFIINLEPLSAFQAGVEVWVPWMGFLMKGNELIEPVEPELEHLSVAFFVGIMI